MTSVARQIEELKGNSGLAAESREEQARDLLIKYQRALGLIEKLAIALLDSVQPDAEPMSPEQSRDRRHTVAEAMTMVAAETPRGEQLWGELALDRRLAHPDLPLPVAVRADRRRKTVRRAAPKSKL
jgi:hypothetical protein